MNLAAVLFYLSRAIPQPRGGGGPPKGAQNARATLKLRHGHSLKLTPFFRELIFLYVLERSIGGLQETL